MHWLDAQRTGSLPLLVSSGLALVEAELLRVTAPPVDAEVLVHVVERVLQAEDHLQHQGAVPCATLGLMEGLCESALEGAGSLADPSTVQRILEAIAAARGHAALTLLAHATRRVVTAVRDGERTADATLLLCQPIVAAFQHALGTRRAWSANEVAGGGEAHQWRAHLQQAFEESLALAQAPLLAHAVWQLSICASIDDDGTNAGA